MSEIKVDAEGRLHCPDCDAVLLCTTESIHTNADILWNTKDEDYECGTHWHGELAGSEVVEIYCPTPDCGFILEEDEVCGVTIIGHDGKIYE